MSKTKTASGNYLDFVPVHNKNINFEINEEGNVTLLIENKGFFNLLTQKLFKKPRISQIHLDEMGNFIWPLIDGNHSVYDISELVKEKFGEKAEPLYERLVQYFKVLESYNFVTIRK